MNAPVRQQVQQMLKDLPPEGLNELAQFIEFLQFKYQAAPPSGIKKTNEDSTSTNVPGNSLTARYKGFVQSPLSVAELTTAYELTLMGDDE